MARRRRPYRGPTDLPDRRVTVYRGRQVKIELKMYRGALRRLALSDDLRDACRAIVIAQALPHVIRLSRPPQVHPGRLGPGLERRKGRGAVEGQEVVRLRPARSVLIPAKADGGRIVGPGTGTSDDVLMYGSNGEWVHRAAAVSYYGDSFMAALNQMAIPREWLPGFSTGGRIGADPVPRYATGGKVMTWPAKIDVNKTLIPALDEVIAAVGGALGGAAGGLGWRWQMKVLRDQFPGLDLYSGFRANSRTSNGSLSWHSRDGVDANGNRVEGRAVDVPPLPAVFDFIHDTYGRNSKELIWGGDPGSSIYTAHTTDSPIRCCPPTAPTRANAGRRRTSTGHSTRAAG
jgi:hypothetical protein